MTDNGSAPVDPAVAPLRRWSWPLAAIVLLAALLRLYRLDLASITADEGVHGLLAGHVALLNVADWPMVGLPSVGIRNSALFIYALAVPHFLFRHPLAGVAAVALVDLAAIVLAYRLAERTIGRHAAWSAGVLLATAPWMVLYARQMWPPSCVPTACLILLHTGLRWLDDQRPKRLAILVFLSCIVPQIHFSGFCAPVWAMIVMGLGQAWKQPAAIVAGLVCGLATWTPWLVFHYQGGWEEIDRALQFARGREPLDVTIWYATMWWQTLLHNARFEYWFAVEPNDLGPRFSPKLLPELLRLCDWAAIAMVVAAMIGAAACAFGWFRRSGRLLLAWSLLPLLLLCVVRPIVHPHYVLVAYPIPFLLVGAVVQLSMQVHWKSIRFAIAIIIASIATAHFGFLAGWFAYVRDGQNGGWGQYQLSYRQRLAAVQSVLDDCPDRVVRLVGAFNGEQPAYQYLYNHEQLRRGYARFPEDPNRCYWMEEAAGGEFVTPEGWRVDYAWGIGPTQIYRLVRSSGTQEPPKEARRQ